MTLHICEGCGEEYDCQMPDGECPVSKEAYGFCGYNCHARKDGRPTLEELENDSS